MNRWAKSAIAGTLILAAVATLLVVFFFTDKSLKRIKHAGTVRIGYAVEAPFAFLKADGEVTGESPEVAKQIVARLGISRAEWYLMNFESLISALEAGRIDVIAAGMFITPERAKRVRFSEPSLHVRQALLTAKGNPWQIHSYEQVLAQPNLKIAVLSGAVEADLLRRIGLPEHQLVTVPDALTGDAAVKSGVADGLALSAPAVLWLARRGQLSGTEAADPFYQPGLALKGRLGFVAFAFRKADRRLCSAWNAAQNTFIGTPEHLALISEFGLTQVDLPGTITTKEVLSR
jgi:polar amino acid transport system substrate-binding protein